MNTNLAKELKQKLLSNQPSIGAWITTPSVTVAEIFARSGFDWIVVDLEHSCISLNTTIDLIRTIDLCGSIPLVRLSELDATLIKRVMDAGAHGIIIPNVVSAEQVQFAYQATRYPPEGVRRWFSKSSKLRSRVQ